MRALCLNCTLKRSPERSNTDALAQVVIDELKSRDVDCETVRMADLTILTGVSSDEGDGDQWPEVLGKVLASEILVIASPTWLGQPSSVSKLALERLDALISETDDDGRPVAYGRVAGVVVTGNEDGAHHVISEIAGALLDIGYTIPGQAWTYWNKGPGPGPDYLDTEEGHEWAHKQARTAAKNLVEAASALKSNGLSRPEQ